ncbi:Crp/Fnr family transcriptional regulator [bacterium]|nr:Crp/Fnr family transcriptional regulator [bacterium]
MNKKFELPLCDQCHSRIHSVFGDLKDSDVKSLNENKCGNIYKKGQVLFYEGNKPTGLFCVNKGKIKTYRINADGKEQIIRLAKEGDVLGYSSLISGDLYSSSAAVIEDAIICYIPRNVFLNLLDSNATFSMKMIRLLSHDLKSSEDRVVNLAQNTVRERLAETLLMLEEFGGTENDGKTLRTSLSREEIANIVGTATETTIRLLSEFRSDGLIELEGKRIKIVNRGLLLKAANVED